MTDNILCAAFANTEAYTKLLARWQ